MRLPTEAKRAPPALLPLPPKRFPLYFEANQGQTAGDVSFLVRAAGYTAYSDRPRDSLAVPQRYGQGETAATMQWFACSSPVPLSLQPSGMRQTFAGRGELLDRQ